MPVYRVDSDSNKEKRKESKSQGAWNKTERGTQTLTRVKEADAGT